MDYQYFYLNAFTLPVAGQAKMAVYNLLTGDIFSLDEKASKIFNNYSPSIKEMIRKAQSLNIEAESVYNLLNELNNLGLGMLSNQKLFIEKVYRDFIGLNLNKDFINLARVSIRVGNKCNLDCFFCKNDCNTLCFPCSRKKSVSDLRLSVPDLKQILKDILLFGCDDVTFIGGNPFLEREHFFSILEYTAKKIKNVSVFTNLTTLPNTAKELIAMYSNIRIIFPFFGNSESSFESITRTTGSFKKLIENISDLKSRNIKFSALILKPINQSVKESIEFCKSRDIDFSIYAPTPLFNDDKTLLCFEGYRVKNSEFPNITIGDFYRHTMLNSCLGEQIVIDFDGNIRPCLYSQDVLGNIFNEGLRNVLRSGRQDKFWYLKKDDIDGCNKCEFRYCCNYDCGVASQNLNDKLNAPYPFCHYDPSAGEWKVKKESQEEDQECVRMDLKN